MKYTKRLVVALVFLAVLVGCSALTPRTYQLEQIHQTYTSEWVEATFPQPSEKAGAAAGPHAVKYLV